MAELALCATAFGIATGITSWYFDQLLPDITLSVTASTVTFWLGVQWGSEEGPGGSRVLIQQICRGAGLTLLLQAVLVYTQIAEPLPFQNVALGSVCAFLLLGAAQLWLYTGTKEGLLILGWGPSCEGIAGALGSDVLGVVESNPSKVPEGVKYLGEYQQLRDVVSTQQPTRIVVGSADWPEWVSPQFLLECRLQGTVVQPAAEVYEQTFQRISVEALRPHDFLWLDALNVSGPVIAMRAIYSNVVGLILLVLLSPLLLLVGGIAWLAAGKGGFFERVECAGFRGIPFKMLRFRLCGADGEKTWFAPFIIRLRLTRLPEVINVIRGEMALFGPRPARMVFGNRLEELLPFYRGRVSVLPGVFGWADVNAIASDSRKSPVWKLQEESIQMGYDLYYLKHGSPALDLAILTRRLLGIRDVPSGSL